MDTLDITAVTKIYNAAIYAAAREVGGVALLAKKLKVTKATVYKWMKLQGCPPKKPTGYWTNKRLKQLRTKLESITGLSWDRIFPDSLRDAVPTLRDIKKIEQTAQVPARMLIAYAETQGRLEDTPNLSQRIEHHELQDAIQESVAELDSRLQTVVNMRFGLNGQPTHTLREVGKHLRISAERVRDLERRALTKIKASHAELASHI